MFIALEGLDFSGKSTQGKMLKEYLELKSISCLFTREPGGCNFAESLREILLSENDIDPLAELLLFNSARAEHLSKVIYPALKEKKTVVCDRFLLSTLCYQGMLKGLGCEIVLALHKICFVNCMPDVTIVLDIDPETAILRKTTDLLRENNIYDELAFNQMQIVRNAFLEAYTFYQGKCLFIDATKSANAIHGEIVQFLGL